MQHLRTEHDCVKVEASFLWVPTSVVYPTHHLEYGHQLNAVRDGNSVLSIAWEDVVVFTNRIT